MGIVPWGNTGISLNAAQKRKERATEFCQFLKANMSKYDKGDGYLNEELIATDLGISRGEVREKYKDMVEDLMSRTKEATETFDFLIHKLKRRLMPEYNKTCVQIDKEVSATLEEAFERW